MKCKFLYYILYYTYLKSSVFSLCGYGFGLAIDVWLIAQHTACHGAMEQGAGCREQGSRMQDASGEWREGGKSSAGRKIVVAVDNAGTEGTGWGWIWCSWVGSVYSRIVIEMLLCAMQIDWG